MERNIRAERILHTDQNDVWVHNGNKLLTLYDEHFIQRKTISLSISLQDMALTTSHEIIATDYVNKRLVKISKTGNVSTFCSTAPLMPFGICINGRQQVVVGLSADWSGTPHIKLASYSSDGSAVLQEIENDEDGKPLFWTGIIQVKQNGSGDYVVAGGGRIVCVSSEGRFKWDCEGSFMGICGMVCDKHDNVIIAAHVSNKILLLSSEGNLVTTLLTAANGIMYPRSLSIDKHGQLWIGQDNNVKVVKYLK